jgi:hypothetical protein
MSSHIGIIETLPRRSPTILKRAVVAAVAASALILAGAVPAQAATVSAGAGRATLYLSQSETRALAEGRVPAAPPATPWQLKGAYYALAYGHKWFAQQYANRGWCSGFRLSIYPWESQGYFGYACTWR